MTPICPQRFAAFTRGSASVIMPKIGPAEDRLCRLLYRFLLLEACNGARTDFNTAG